MTDRITFLIPFFLIIVAYFKGSWAAPVQGDDQKDWTVYEDVVLRFKHPKDAFVKDHELPEEKEHSWAVYSAKPLRELIAIEQYRDGSEKRTLDKIVAEHKVNWHQYKMISGPTRVALKNGECLQYRVEGYVRGCRDFGDGDEPMPKLKCIRAYAEAACYNKKKDYFEISSKLSQYMEKGKPDERAKTNGKIFDTVLKSIEFK